VSLEADVDTVPMVFPLGPDLYLSWATCTVRNNSDPEKTAVYRCELKPGYRSNGLLVAESQGGLACHIRLSEDLCALLPSDGSVIRINVRCE